MYWFTPTVAEKSHPVMARLKERITYQYEETPLGGRVRIVTRDAAALAAVHAFLHFQIEDHQTEDSGVVQQPSAPGRTMNGLGRGMMMQGGQDAAPWRRCVTSTNCSPTTIA